MEASEFKMGEFKIEKLQGRVGRAGLSSLGNGINISRRISYIRRIKHIRVFVFDSWSVVQETRQCLTSPNINKRSQNRYFDLTRRFKGSKVAPMHLGGLGDDDESVGVGLGYDFAELCDLLVVRGAEQHVAFFPCVHPYSL